MNKRKIKSYPIVNKISEEMKIKEKKYCLFLKEIESTLDEKYDAKPTIIILASK